MTHPPTLQQVPTLRVRRAGWAGPSSPKVPAAWSRPVRRTWVGAGRRAVDGAPSFVLGLHHPADSTDTALLLAR